ncbi:unnamed protein product, partial [Amoebophrya sp. A25]
MTKNKLTSLAQLRGEDFPSLKILRCKGNLLLSDSLQLALPRLKELYLGRNQLSSIPPLTGLPSLEVLILNHNRIQTELFGKDLAKAKELRKVDLRANLIANNPNNFLKSLVRLQGLTKLSMFKIAENPFCALFPEYQSVLYGFLAAAGVVLKQLDRIALGGAADGSETAEKNIDPHMIEVYEQLVTEVHIPDGETLQDYVLDAKLISPTSAKVVADTDIPAYAKDPVLKTAIMGGARASTAKGGPPLDPTAEIEDIKVLAGDLLLMDGRLQGTKLETFLLATASSFKYPLCLRFLQLAHLSMVFNERLENMAPAQMALFGAEDRKGRGMVSSG